MKPIRIYSIAPHYRKVTVWLGSRMTGSRHSVETCTPNKGLSREERHKVIAAYLYKEHGIPGPVYQP